MIIRWISGEYYNLLCNVFTFFNISTSEINDRDDIYYLVMNFFYIKMHSIPNQVLSIVKSCNRQYPPFVGPTLSILPEFFNLLGWYLMPLRVRLVASDISRVLLWFNHSIIEFYHSFYWSPEDYRKYSFNPIFW